MTGWALQVPDSPLAALRKAPHEMAREAAVAATIHWCQQGLESMECAAETASMDRPQFLAKLARRNVYVVVVIEDLQRELSRA